MDEHCVKAEKFATAGAPSLPQARDEARALPRILPKRYQKDHALTLAFARNKHLKVLDQGIDFAQIFAAPLLRLQFAFLHENH